MSVHPFAMSRAAKARFPHLANREPKRRLISRTLEQSWNWYYCVECKVWFASKLVLDDEHSKCRDCRQESMIQ